MTTRLDLPGDFEHLAQLQEAIAATLGGARGLKDAPALIYNLQLAAQEIAANIVEHAYDGGRDPALNRIRATLSVERRPARVVITLIDTGRPFDPDSAPAPDLEEPQIGGYGLFIARALLDELGVTHTPEGNSWRLVKNLT